jgi:two-component system cell cycle sensor histidine kinase/response regulator CckA
VLALTEGTGPPLAIVLRTLYDLVAMENPTRKTTILVVDDEPEIRKLVSAMLSTTGYSIILADTGEQAIKLFRKQPNAIDLLLADVVAPGMAGPTLADQLTELKPDLKVLFMSGYDSRQVVQKYVVEKGYMLLTKPFTVKQLEEKVAEALKGSRASRSGGLS